MELMLRKDGVYKQELFIQYEVHENKFFFETINEQIPKGDQKDRDISSLWW